MAFDFRYPLPGGTGAVSGTDLVTACGRYDPFSEGGTVSIKGKIYPGSTTPTDATPPDGSSVGTVVPSSNTWHFNGCTPKLSGCTVGEAHVMRVWLTSTAVGFYLTKDCPFTGCVSGSGSCTPDCPQSAPQPLDGSGAGPVICEVAARHFLVVPAPSLLPLLDVFGVPHPHKLGVLLTFDEPRSTFHCAVWSSKVVRGEQLRLEATRGGCNIHALLARVRVTAQQVFTLERWSSQCFDVLHGGPMDALTICGQWCEGSVLVKPVTLPLAIAPGLPLSAATEALPAPVKKAARRRGRR
jgi:hypothetical protein